MRNAGFMNVDNIVYTSDHTDVTTEDKEISQSYDQTDDESALFQVYNHFRTDKK